MEMDLDLENTPVTVPAPVQIQPLPPFTFQTPAFVASDISGSAPRFSMGVITRRPRHERHHREIRRRRFSKKLKKVKPSSGKPFWPAFPLSQTNNYGFLINFTLASFPRSSVQAVLHMRKLLIPPDENSFFALKPHELESIKNAFEQNIRARWAFRKLLIQWKIKHSKVMNEVDPITLEAFSEPIDIYNLQTKSIHRFEAKTLARSWRTNLLNHDGIFPDPRIPTNPLTNLACSLLQIHNTWKVLKSKGYNDWILDSYAACRYDLQRWQKKFGTPLKMETLEAIFADKNSYDRIDMLMDFAELQHEYHGKKFQTVLFQWIFSSQEVIDYANLWITACKRFYMEKYTILEKEDLEDLEIRTSIINAHLIDIPKVVRLTYLKYIEGQNGRRRRVQNRVIQSGGDGDISTNE